jgi:hypothetical protein
MEAGVDLMSFKQTKSLNGMGMSAFYICPLCKTKICAVVTPPNQETENKLKENHCIFYNLYQSKVNKNEQSI